MYISELRTCPRGTVIADLGCGDATLARALVPQGLNVLSYDLVPDGVYVIEADICVNIPLPGSEPEEGTGQGHIVDVAVCALSLMGSNWPKCIREAWRILKPTYVSFVADSSHQQPNQRHDAVGSSKSPRFRVDLKMSTSLSPSSRRSDSSSNQRSAFIACPTVPVPTEIILLRTREIHISQLSNFRKLLGGARRSRIGRNSC